MMKTKNLILTAFFITLGVLIPFTTAHAFGVPGTVLLPMHIPVLLCGLMLGAREGLICGIVTPIISSLLTNMPSVYPMLPIMAGELGTYGVVSGLVYGHCEEKISNFRRGNPASLWLLKVTGLLRRVAPRNDVLKLYIALILAMICGRVVYGLIYSALLLAGEHSSPLRALSVWGAVSTGVIGIIIQLILIPPLVRGLTKASPYSIIRQGDASFIIRVNLFKYITSNENGIKPILDVYENSPELLFGKKIYDRVIGKAAAIICVLGGVKKVFGKVMSKSAKEYLEKHNVKFEFDLLVEHIQNRKGNGICPMEQCVLGIDDAMRGLEAIKKKSAS